MEVIHTIKITLSENAMSDFEMLQIKGMKGKTLIQFLYKFTQEDEYYNNRREADKIRVLLPKVSPPVQGILIILGAHCGLYDILHA